jgi:hypothetical protein
VRRQEPKRQVARSAAFADAQRRSCELGGV